MPDLNHYYQPPDHIFKDKALLEWVSMQKKSLFGSNCNY